MTHAHLILNPAAGRGAGGKALDRVTRAFARHGWTVQLTPTARPGHGAELATVAARDGVACVVAVGGDGTVHEVANGLLAGAEQGRARPVLGVVPIGSGNDFAKLLGVYRHSPERAVDRLVTAAARRFDVGRAFGEYFVNTMGLGFGPAVVRRRNALAHLSGFLSYLVPIVQTFATFEPPRLDVEAAEHREAGYMMMVEVCNGTTAGGSYRFAPEADPSDGRLDVCLVRRVSLPRFLLALPRVMRGTHTTMREFAVFQTDRVTVRSPDAPLVAHLDGELREPGVRDCTVTIEPRRLSVLVAR